ncbi:MAG: F0F1 ATP synthase subunit A [Planctomycetaceae bacterium]|nr:F0F1 ATP synthase subunit A [Planctomycetaceae bacterium]
MASPVLHVKDSYYFEVPKAIWSRNYTSMDEVPTFLREAHPDASLEQFNHDLSGKILIPQPFGTLKNLYEVESGFGISKLMVVELLVAVLLAVVFIWLAKRGKETNRPVGRRHNLLESFVGYVRDEIVRPAIGGHDADKYVPYLLTAFFFILACNLIGMVPGLGTVTSAIEVTAVLAFCTFVIGVVSGVQHLGAGGFLMNFMPDVGDNILLQPIRLLIFAIELLGLFIKHAVLAVRLFGNMVAGHMVLAGVLATVVAAAGSGWWPIAAFFGILGATALSALEILVAFIQAYVFTMLSAIFIGMSIHKH